MKIAGVILGLIGSLMGIFGGICSGALAEAAETHSGDFVLALAWAACGAGIVFSIVLAIAKSKKVGVTTAILLLLASGGSFFAANVFSAPLMALGGLLGLVGALRNEK
ncbi:MAG: hypothetical protein D6767_02965 [Candidatus Hydrogenedentota bacterium]|nr:MAG: hypothetical protein D6767_02965 [Candidatus Hydrogenedentota bacterium]